MSNNPETFKQGPERDQTPEVKLAAQERLEELREHHEKASELAERSKEKIDDARHEIEQLDIETKKKPAQEREGSPVERRSGPISKRERAASFKATMNEVQAQMPAPSRAFSKVIHNKAVEQVSESLGSTIARPNAILMGAVFAFLLTLAVYLIAKNLGYRLTGFESIGAFVLGWVVGLIYDFLKVMITGRQ